MGPFNNENANNTGSNWTELLSGNEVYLGTGLDGFRFVARGWGPMIYWEQPERQKLMS